MSRPGAIGFALVASLCLLAASSTATAQAATITIDNRGHVLAIGAFKVQRDPRLRKAIAAFGDPDVRFNPSGSNNACHVGWKTLGLTMLFANFGLGPNDPTACDGRHGNAQTLVVKGRRGRTWRTWAGLRVGMSERELRRRHPRAVRRSDGYWLTTVMHPYGAECPCAAPGIRAKLTRGRVSSLRAWIGAAGD